MKHVLLGIIASALICTTGHAQTNLPQRPVKICRRLRARGAMDVATRVFSSEMTKTLKQQVIVENRGRLRHYRHGLTWPNRRPDGYTLEWPASARRPSRPKCDPQCDLRSHTRLRGDRRRLSADFLLCARANLPQKTLQDLLAYAKANPGKVAYGSVGIASPNHVQHEELARLGGSHDAARSLYRRVPDRPGPAHRSLDIALLTVNAAEPFIRKASYAFSRRAAPIGPPRSPTYRLPRKYLARQTIRRTPGAC